MQGECVIDNVRALFFRLSNSTAGLDDGEIPPFPRGGQESLTPLEKRVIHEQVKQELFNEVSVVMETVI